MSPTVRARALFACLASLSLSACTRTVIETRSSPAADADESVSPALPAEGDASLGDAGASSSDEDSGDGAASTERPSRIDASTADASATSDAGPVLVGGRITLTCPQGGFHQNPPIVIASVPSAALPRCSAATKTCYLNAATYDEANACLEADTTAPAVVDGAPIDCAECERSQGAYCVASACRSEYSAYACCAQARGEAACQAELAAVRTCLGGAGNAAFSACFDALASRCFM